MPAVSKESKGLAPSLSSGILGIYDIGDGLSVDINTKKNFAVVPAVNGKNTPYYGNVQAILVLPVSKDWVRQIAFPLGNGTSAFAIRDFVSGNTWTDWTRYDLSSIKV